MKIAYYSQVINELNSSSDITKASSFEINESSINMLYSTQSSNIDNLEQAQLSLSKK